jgi:3-phosphoshikimate 1-carboxyvinyltransferase
MAIAHDLIVHPPARPLVGIVPVVPDDDIGSLVLLLGALASGASELHQLGAGPSVTALLAALRQLGVRIEQPESATWRVHGVGLRGLSAATASIDVGTSRAALAALTGALVAQPFASRLTGQGALEAHDLSALAGALRLRGARIEGAFALPRVGVITLPLQIEALELPHLLGEIEHVLPRPDPHLKTALLISGLYADGSTYVSEPLVSRDHAERLFQALDLPLATLGSLVHLESVGWEARIPNFRSEVPGDFGSATLLLAAGLLVPGSQVGTRNVGLNRTRTGFLEITQQMGARFAVEVHQNPLGEPLGVAMTGHAELKAMHIEGEMLARAETDTAALLALSARARGESRLVLPFGDPAAPEERATLGQLASVLRAFGVTATPIESGLAVVGRPEGPLSAANVRCANADSAVLALLLALISDGPSRLAGIDALAARYPRIVGTLRALGADLHVEKRTE